MTHAIDLDGDLFGGRAGRDLQCLTISPIVCALKTSVMIDDKAEG
jgi:hypothetical protein